MIKRRSSRTIRVGKVPVGGKNPVSVQSMVKELADDVEGSLAQIRALDEAGCDIVRVAVPNARCARLLGRIVRGSPIPVVADIHFNYRLALEAIAQGVHCVRVNPGNMTDEEGLRRVARLAGEKGIPLRIGVNSGSILRKGEKARTSVELVEKMVQRTVEAVRLFEAENCRNLKLSLKASDILVTMEASRSAARLTDYPLHIGTTATGPLEEGIVKSAIVIGGLLSEGIGDTIRVSLTAPPEEEVKAGISILEALGLREPRNRLISCPTCGRSGINLVRLVEDVRKRINEIPEGISVAVMGCVVNGPGEAREADVGIAGGKRFGLLFRRGRRVRRIPEEQLVEALIEEAQDAARPARRRGRRGSKKR